MLSLIRPIRHFYIRICTIYIYRKICILEKYIYSRFCLFEIFAVNNLKKLLTKIFSVLDSHHFVLRLIILAWKEINLKSGNPERYGGGANSGAVRYHHCSRFLFDSGGSGYADSDPWFVLFRCSAVQPVQYR